jgi:biotin carboxyl carrier protein
MRYYVQVAGETRVVEVTSATDGRLQVKLFRKTGSKSDPGVPDLSCEVDVHRTDDVTYLLNIGGRPLESHVLPAATGPAATVCVSGRTFDVECRTELEEELSRADRGSGSQSQDRLIRTRMPGKVVAVHAKPGDVVQKGSRLVVLEAMKMENEIQAQGAGRVAAVHVKPGDAVEGGALLVELAPDETEAT